MEGGGNPVPPLLWEAVSGNDGGLVVFGTSSTDPLSARSLGDAGSGGSGRNSLTRVDDDQIGRMVHEEAPGVLGGMSTNADPWRAQSDPHVTYSHTSRSVSGASSEMKRNAATRHKKEKIRKSRQEKQEEFTAMIPKSILDEYPTKSLQRCFTKVGEATIKSMSEAQIRSAYKSWRAAEAQQRKELRATKRSHASTHSFGRTRDNAFPHERTAYEHSNRVGNGDSMCADEYDMEDETVAKPLTKRQKAMFQRKNLEATTTGVPHMHLTGQYVRMSNDDDVKSFIDASLDDAYSSSEYISNTESEMDGSSVRGRRSSSDTITVTSTGVAGTAMDSPSVKKLRRPVDGTEREESEGTRLQDVGPPARQLSEEVQFSHIPLLHSDSTISLANAAATAAELMTTNTPRSRTNSREVSSPRQIYLSSSRNDSSTSLASMDTIAAVERAASALERYESVLSQGSDNGSPVMPVPRRRFSGESSGVKPDNNGRIRDVTVVTSSNVIEIDEIRCSSSNDNQLANHIYPSMASLALAGEIIDELGAKEVDLSISFQRDRAGSDAAEVLANVQAIMMSRSQPRGPAVEK